MSSLKKYEELKKLCESYNGSKERFSQIISAYIELDESHKTRLASDLQFSQSAIGRWANNQPPSDLRLRKKVVSYIFRRVKYRVRILKNAIAMKGEKDGTDL